MPSYRLVNFIGYRLCDGLTPEGLASMYSQFHEASKKQHPWLMDLGADPSRRRTGRKASGRTTAVRPDAPPSDWAKKHGWKSESENLNSISQFLMGTGNAGVVSQIASKQRKVVTPDG